MAEILTAEQQEEQLSEQRVIRREKLKALQTEGRDPYKEVRFDFTCLAADAKAKFETLESAALAEAKAKGLEAPETPVMTGEEKLAGRLLSKRGMGKASFSDLQDGSGKIQLYVSVDDLGAEEYERFKKLDIGDIVGVTGNIFRTKRGEVSCHVRSLKLLSKSLQPLPEKYHGLTDTELRYRQRYVDLIVNPEVKETFRKRSKIMAGIRRYLDERGYLEVETPILTPFEIGAAARPFLTHHNTLDMDMVLRIETELYLKRLIVGGIDRVYEIGRIFRNEGMDPKHNPEFTSIELYQAYTDFHGMMDIVEGLFKSLADEVCGTRRIPYQGKTIDFDNWTRMTMIEAVKKYSGVDFAEVKTDEEAIALAKQYKVELPEVPTKGSILPEFFDAFVEENLIQPTFIYDYPVEISPLAKRKPDDPAFTERFEFFINATEFGNAFSELNDPIDQKARFERQVAERKAVEPGAKCQVDYDFVNALEYGMPPTGGLGIGIDRLVMLLTDSASIRDVLFFPTMKPEGANKPSAAAEAPADFECACNTCPSQEACKAAQEAEKAAPVEEKIDFSNVAIEPLFADFVDFETFSKSDFRAVKVLECEAVPKSKKLLKFTLNDGTDTPRTILSGIHAFYEPEELVGKTLLAITNLPPRAMMGLESCGMLLSCLHTEEGEEKLNLIRLDPRIPAGAKVY
jgi:lysyl-tRNA synthetase class 2